MKFWDATETEIDMFEALGRRWRGEKAVYIDRARGTKQVISEALSAIWKRQNSACFYKISA